MYLLLDSNFGYVKQTMQEFEETGKMTMSEAFVCCFFRIFPDKANYLLFQRSAAKLVLTSQSVSQNQVRNAIQHYYSEYDYILDPHSAVGAHVMQEKSRAHPTDNYILLCTASPHKFKETVDSILGKDLHLTLYQDLESLPKFCKYMREGEDWEEKLRKEVETITSTRNRNRKL